MSFFFFFLFIFSVSARVSVSGQKRVPSHVFNITTMNGKGGGQILSTLSFAGRK